MKRHESPRHDSPAPTVAFAPCELQGSTERDSVPQLRLPSAATNAASYLHSYKYCRALHRLTTKSRSYSSHPVPSEVVGREAAAPAIPMGSCSTLRLTNSRILGASRGLRLGLCNGCQGGRGLRGVGLHNVHGGGDVLVGPQGHVLALDETLRMRERLGPKHLVPFGGRQPVDLPLPPPFSPQRIDPTAT